MNGLKHAFRTLAKTPFITGVAILSLALGIGANAAIFSLFDQLLLRSLPVQEPDRLVNLKAPGPNHGSTSCNQAGDCDEIFSYPMFRDLERAETGLEGLAAHRLFGANLASADGTTSGEGLFVSGSYFSLLGVRPALGRLLTPADDERAGENFVAVLSYRYWNSQLGADPSVLNATLVVNGQPLTVVGVAARGFEGTTLGGRPDVFVPISMREVVVPGWKGLEDRRSYWAYLYGRMRPGASLEQTQAGINAVYSALLNDVEAPLQEGMSARTLERFRAKEVLLSEGYRGQSSIHSEADTPLRMLLAITGLVLLIACANIANLLLARGASRGREMAIRGSLGASRMQLLGQLLTESVLLALLGGIASLVVARWTLSGIVASLPPEDVSSMGLSLSISPSVLAFTAVLSIGTGLLFGMYPSLHSSRQDLVSMLKAGGGQPASERSAVRFRSALVTTQIAFSMALLVSAGLFIKSLVNVSRIDLGLRTDNVVAFGLSPELNGYEKDRTRGLFREVEDALSAIPGVTDEAAAMVPVLAGSNWGTDVSVEGYQGGPDIDTNARFNLVGPRYFTTLGMPLVAGREFDESDALGAPKVAVVNEAFTRKFNLDGRNAIGKFMATNGGQQEDLDIRIVGVVRDARYADVKQSVPPLFFTPYRQDERVGQLTFYVRTALDETQLLAAIPGVIRTVDPTLPVEDLKTLEQQAKESVFMDRMIGTLSAAFALLATLLAAVGLYGVLSFTVAQRTREIGVRMALGARRHNVRAMVLKQVSRMTVVGGIVGVAAAFALGKLAESLLFGIEGGDPWVVTAVSVLLAGVAFGAAYLPARKASRVDPVHALRYE
jgi:putative ABC transport system permease protein